VLSCTVYSILKIQGLTQQTAAGLCTVLKFGSWKMATVDVDVTLHLQTSDSNDMVLFLLK